MANGSALIVGVKSVDPAAYQGWDGTTGCWGCELDAENMQRLLAPLGFTVTSIRTADATAARVLRELGSAANSLRDGDLFVFYFSGHGGQQPDFDGDEADNHDETLVLYDRELVDDELNGVWVRFRPGVRIVMLSDSCNSGTNYRRIGHMAYRPTPMEPITEDASLAMKAPMIHMGGCRDIAFSSGYLSGGAFTIALCNAWSGGKFSGSYRDLYDQIVAGVHTGQQPQFNEYGPVGEEFRNQRPFTI